MAAFDHAQSPRLGQPTPVENPGVQLVTQATLPEVARRGQIVFLLDIDEFRVHNGVAWQNPAAGSSIVGTQTFVGPTAPAADKVGDLWMNTTSYQLYAWDGTAWKPAVDPVAQAAATAASVAQAKAEQALGLAAGKTTIWYLDVQPGLPTQQVVVGDYWINTVTNKLYKFTTLTTVTEVQDQDIANALNQAGTAQATADQKIESFTVLWADRPMDLGPLGIGDILFAIDQGNSSYRWNGSDWVALGASTVPSVTVTQGLSLSSGAIAHVESQSSMVLDGSITPPSTAPTFAQVYQYPAACTITDVFTPSFTTNEFLLGGIAFSSTNLYVAMNQYSTGRTKALGAIYKFALTGGNQIAKYNFSFSNRYEIRDCVIDQAHNSLHLAMRDVTNGNYWLQRVVLSTMAVDATVSRNTTSGVPHIGIDCDGTYIYLTRINDPDNYLMMTRFNQADYSYVGDYTSTVKPTVFRYGAPVGSFPGMGGNRMVCNIAIGSGAQSMKSFSYSGTTLTQQTAEEFPNQYNGGFDFDGANFRQAYYTFTVGTPFPVSKYSNDTSTTPRWISADYRSVHTVTGANLSRTPPSPKVKVVPVKRSYLQITGPPIPPDPNPGTEGDVNAVGIYIGTGTTEPLNTGMWLQTPELTIGNRTLTVGDLGPVVTGTNPLAVSTFPAGIPGLVSSASVRSDGTPKNYVDGAGGARLDGLLPPGSMTAFAGSFSPTGWHKCDGASLSTSAFPELFAAVGYTFGGSGTTFQLPNISPGTNLIWLIKL